ncbi:MAG TPA: polysaccharide deacetylase family protein [Pyrinomonadaceae bacterium]|nr:polysaccharide deacetylase family protein [Pyrinomonadaceae bacterium]
MKRLSATALPNLLTKPAFILRRAFVILLLTCLAAGSAADAARVGQRERVARAVAVTIDDLPVVAQGDLRRHQEITRKLLASLRAHRVPAVGFVNEGKLVENGVRQPARVALLRAWVEAGLELGNHTFSHHDLHTTPLEQFQRDVIRGEEVTRALLKERGKQLRYFRHPFLHTGADLETKRRFEEFLAARGYRIAPVTHDNSEWIFARAYDNAWRRGDRQLMARIGRDYVDYMERRFEYFEQQSVQLFGYEMKKTLLIHANALNADYFDELARMMRRRGYQFITLDEALTDKAYRSPDAYAGPGGITWVHRWAITAGKTSDFFRGEPRTPAYIMKEAGVERE